MARITDNYIVESLSPPPNFPKCDIWSSIEKVFLSNKQEIVFVDPITTVNVKYAELHEQVESIAAGLHYHGFSPNKPFCIYMSNCLEYMAFVIAVWRLGGTIALVNPMLTSEEFASLLKMVDSEFVACNNVTVHNTIAAAARIKIQKIFTKEEHPGCISIPSLYKCPKSAINDFKPYLDFDPTKQTAVIQFSSGTTGPPKAVEMSHIALSFQYNLLFQYGYVDESINEIVLPVPLSHIAGLIAMLGSLLSGRLCVIMPNFDLVLYVSLISKYKLSKIQIVPPIAVVLCKSGLVGKYGITHVKTIYVGAAPLSKEQEEDLKQTFGQDLKVVQGYGMTETIGVFSYVDQNSPLKCPAGSVGWPGAGSQMKIIDITGKQLGPNKQGEICMKNDNLMTGYYKNPKATSNTIDKDGWLHSGDVGYYDKDGFLFVVDRIKELIKYKGYQVAPSELEGLILSHPKVGDVGVASVPDDIAGELPFALIVRKPGVELTEMDIHNFVNEKVASFKRLRGGIKFVDVIPKSLNGKILRRKIKEQITKYRQSKI